MEAKKTEDKFKINIIESTKTRSINSSRLIHYLDVTWFYINQHFSGVKGKLLNIKQTYTVQCLLEYFKPSIVSLKMKMHRHVLNNMFINICLVQH
jgi:hypothetical protein